MDLPPVDKDAAQLGQNSHLHLVDDGFNGAMSILEPLGLPVAGDSSEQVTIDIGQFWHDRQLEYDMHARCFKQRGHFYPPSTIAELCWKSRQKAQIRVYQIAMTEIVNHYERRQVAFLKGRLLAPAHDRLKAQQELFKWVDLIAAEDSEPPRLAYYRIVFSQLIWQVKRRLRGLDAHWQVMPILVGPQGTGKSSAVKKLARPLDFLYMENGEIGLFADRFRARVFEQRYLITFDEIGSAARELLDAIKRVITAKHVGGRKIYSSDETVFCNNASFIGTSNFSITDKLSDPTGMRRFAEVECRKAEWTPAYGQQMADIDYHLLWGAETGEEELCPMQVNRELARSFQSLTVVRSHFDYWADDFLEVTDKPDDVLIAEDAYIHFRTWMQEQQLKPLSRQRFVKALDDRYGHRGRTRTRSAMFSQLTLRRSE